MKKILSLLSVLTISGTAVPTTIAASPYQKEKQINLENLIRNKREIKNNILGIKRNIFKTNGAVKTSGVVLNNKLYFGSLDKNVYEYDFETETKKLLYQQMGSLNLLVLC